MKSITLFFAFFLLLSSHTLFAKDGENRWTISDLLQNQATAFAIAHRGYGDNLGEDSSRPIENTRAAVVRAFEEGISLVEIDVVITADKRAVVLHDDFLDDFTCVNSLSYDQLKQRLPHVPKLKHVLKDANKFTQTSTHISGLVNIEIKTPSPLCDPLDVSEQDLVAAVIDAVDKSNYHNQVIVEAFSPKILSLFASQAPSLARNFSMTILQFLSAEQVTAITGLPVSEIDKDAGFSLNWAELGFFFRLPGYQSLQQYAGVAFTIAQLATVDKEMLFFMEQTQAGSAAAFIAQLHALGLKVTTYTVDSIEEWLVLAAMGVDAIYTNDIPMGLSLQ